MTPDLWFHVSAGLIALAIASVAFAMARGPVAPERLLGLRGLKRQKARRKGGFFVTVEPAIRKVAGWVSFIELGNLRRRTELLLMYAGDWFGLSADEMIAAVLLAGFSGFSFVAPFVWLADYPVFLIPLFGIGGSFIIVFQVRQEVDLRRRNVGRQLPGAIDLMALCMSAGLDFAGAVAQIVKNAPLEDDPLIEEFGLILYHLQLGHSRSRALQVFAARIPTEAVSDFVFAVVQAEQKGNPLRETLRVQATVLRNRRSVRAEELAAKAEQKMLIPMSLMLACILVMVGGPLLMKVSQSGIF